MNKDSTDRLSDFDGQKISRRSFVNQRDMACFQARFKPAAQYCSKG